MYINTPPNKLMEEIRKDKVNSIYPRIDVNKAQFKTSSSYIIELLLLLNQQENVEEILSILLNEITDANANIPNQYFESFLKILGNSKFYSYNSIVEKIFNIIYDLISMRRHKSVEYFNFFTQPIFMDIYFQFFHCNFSMRTLSVVLKRKHQILCSYNDIFCQKLYESDFSDSLLELISQCIKINENFVPIDQILLKLDQIVKFTNDSAVFCSSIELMTQVLKSHSCYTPQILNQTIYYMSNDNYDDVDKICLLKLFESLIEITKSFSFLANNIFYEKYLIYTFTNYQAKSAILEALADLLGIDADVSDFVISYPLIIKYIILDFCSYPFKVQKKLLNFLLNLIIVGNANVLKYSIELELDQILALFLGTETNRILTKKILMVMGLMVQNGFNLSNDLFVNVEKFSVCETDEEISMLSLTIMQKIEYRIC